MRPFPIAVVGSLLLTLCLVDCASAQEDRGVVELALAPAFPIGTVIPYAGLLDEQTAVALDNAGWVPGDGRTLPRAGKYSKLAAVLKDKFRRPGDDIVNSFRLPDLVGRTAVGASTGPVSGPGSNPIGATGGADRVTLSAADLPHAHRVEGKTTEVTEFWCCASQRSLPATDGYTHNHTVSLDSQGVKSSSPYSFDNRQPFLNLYFLVRFK